MKNNILKLIIFLIVISALFFAYKKYVSSINSNKPVSQPSITLSTNNANTALENLKNNTTNIETKEEIDTTNIPILMYHHIKNCDDSCDEIEKGLSVSPEGFDAQMKYLSDNGFKTVNLSDIFYKSDNKEVVLTFDDGYTDNIENALPILQKYGFRATLFIISDFVGNDRYMNWDQIKSLAKNGWDLGAHTLNHPNLVSLSSDDAKAQIEKSKADIEKNTNIKVSFFSYPAGKFDENVASLVNNADYLGAVTTIYDNVNNKDQIYELTRIRINGSDSLESFASKVSY